MDQTRQAIPNGLIEALSPYSRSAFEAPIHRKHDLDVIHLEIQLQEWIIPPNKALRWQNKDYNNNETWRKRPLIHTDDLSIPYSCGEIRKRILLSGVQRTW